MENLKTKHKYSKYLFTSNLRFMYLYGLILFLSLPLLILFMNTTDFYVYQIGKALNVIIAVIASILIPLKVYKFTTSKNALDVYDSLPIQKETLFHCHFVNGLIQLLLPLVISWIGGLCVYILLGGDASFIYDPTVLSVLFIPNELFILLEVGIGLICCFSITTFVKQNCGTIIDTFIYTIVVHLLPLMTYLAFYLFCSSTLVGFQEPLSNNSFIHFLSPIPSITMIVNRSSIAINSVDFRFIYLLIVSIILYYFSSKLYVNHKCEQAENPFSNQFFFPITSILCAITCMIFIHTLTSELLAVNDFTLRYIYPILIGGCLYLILDVIANRGFRHIIKASLSIAFIGSIVLALLFPIQFTKGFGYVTSIPKVESVDSVSITYDSYGPDRFNFNDYNEMVTYDDPKDIETIINFHAFILSKYQAVDYNEQTFYSKYNSSDHNTYYSTITFSYDVAVGTKNRTYTIDSAWLKELDPLRLSKANSIAMYPFLDNELGYLIDKVSISDNLETNENLINKQLIDLAKLKENILSDLQNETLDQKINNSYSYGYLNFFTTLPQKNKNHINQPIFNVPLYMEYTNTLAYLKDHGIEILSPNLSETTSYNLILIENENTVLDYNWTKAIDERQATLEENYLPITEFPYKYKVIESNSAILKEIIPYANHKYIENNHRQYFILMDNLGHNYFILNEKMVEKIEIITKDIPYLTSNFSN